MEAKVSTGARRPRNGHLIRVRHRASSPEFYTQYGLVEYYMGLHLEADPDALRGKRVLCPCNDGPLSAFTQWFARNFARLGLRELVCVTYAPGLPGWAFVGRMRGGEDEGAMAWEPLRGDGDFRSAEVTALRDGCDLVFTNPPFHLKEAFMRWWLEVGGGVVMNPNVLRVGYLHHYFTYGVLRAVMGRGRECHEFSHGGGMLCVWVTSLPVVPRGRPRGGGRVGWAENEGSGYGYAYYDGKGWLECGRVDRAPTDFEGVMGVPMTWWWSLPNGLEVLGDSSVMMGNRRMLVGGREKYVRYLARNVPGLVGSRVLPVPPRECCREGRFWARKEGVVLPRWFVPGYHGDPRLWRGDYEYVVPEE